jgi:CheY-like chemotaxis protein
MATILVIDDTAAFRNLIAAHLRKADFQIICASNGEDGLAAIESHRPDLVLLDLDMPQLDGLAVLDKMHSNPATRDIPAIVLTAGDDPGSIARLGNLNPNDCLFKTSFSAAKLIARIHQHLAVAAR